MKKIFVTLTIILLLPLMVNAKDKVKVYMFEAGGCPYCEAQMEYFEGLESYGKKFEVIRKELYVDHVDWEKGADYNLGYTVANAFKNVGFEDASYKGTPFVVISDIYAVAGYSTSLEEVINEAYENGDKDIVGCYEKGNKNCLDHLKTEDSSSSSSSGSSAGAIVTTIISALVILVTYLIKSTMDTNKIIETVTKRK